jgi:hypothetical protein
VYLSKDVRIRGYFSKPEGPCEQKRSRNSAADRNLDVPGKNFDRIRSYWTSLSLFFFVANALAFFELTGILSLLTLIYFLILFLL